MGLKIVTIHQPEHMPWLGFMNKMIKSDVFVLLDNVQYEKNYFQNRNRIATRNGDQYITVPVETKGHTTKVIKEMVIANTLQPQWKMKYLKTLAENYRKHPYFKTIFPEVEQIINKYDRNICDLNIELIKMFAKLLSADCSFIRASELSVGGAKSDLVLDICRALGADVYISGPSGRDYMNMESFNKAGIRVSFNDFVHPSYTQKNLDSFHPYLSTLDLLMNVSQSEGRDIILSGLPNIIADNGEVIK